MRRGGGIDENRWKQRQKIASGKMIDVSMTRIFPPGVNPIK